MESNKELVQSLIDSGVLKSKDIIKAFLDIDRIDFVLPKYKDIAYRDIALPIGYDQTVSQPYTVAFMLELLNLKEGHKVLDIGSGSGWSTALLSSIVGREGYVYGVELLQELVDMGRENISKYNLENAEISKATDKLGIPGEVFDRILVSASAKKFPKELLDQLKENGVMVIPIQESIYKVIKKKEEVIREEYYGFSFVELKTI
jgi:protein-L-isoaspartate(D-aspartate) O-methyltransferase